MNEHRQGIKVTASDALEFEPLAPKIKQAGKALKLLLFVILAVGGGAVGWAFYGDRIVSLFADADSDVPIVRAEPGPVKVRPTSPGGLQVPDRDKLVYNRIRSSGADEDIGPSVEHLLPMPETPMAAPVAADPILRPVQVPVIPSTETSVETSGERAGVTPIAPAVAAPVVPLAEPATKLEPEKLANGIEVPPAKPKRIDKTPRVADVTRAEKPVLAPSAPRAPQAAPSQPVSSTPNVTAAVRPVPSRTPAVVKPKLRATPAARQRASTTGKGYKVQLAAARSPAAARSEWDRLRAKHLDLLGDLGLSITKVDLGSVKGVFYRLRVGPLRGEGEARVLCKALVKRKVSCLLVRPGK